MLRFKLDESADPRWRVPLQEAGIDVCTVAAEGLQGTFPMTGSAWHSVAVFSVFEQLACARFAL